MVENLSSCDGNDAAAYPSSNEQQQLYCDSQDGTAAAATNLNSASTSTLNVMDDLPLQDHASVENPLLSTVSEFSLSVGIRSVPAAQSILEEVSSPNDILDTHNAHHPLPYHNRRQLPVQLDSAIGRNGSLADSHASAESILRNISRSNMSILSSPGRNVPTISRSPVHSWTSATSDLLIDRMVETEQNLHESFRDQLFNLSTTSSTHSFDETSNSAAVLPRTGRLRSLFQNIMLVRNDPAITSRASIARVRPDMDIVERDRTQSGTDIVLETIRSGYTRRQNNEATYAAYNRNHRAFSDSFVNDFELSQSFNLNEYARTSLSDHPHSQSISLNDLSPIEDDFGEGHEPVSLEPEENPSATNRTLPIPTTDESGQSQHHIEINGETQTDPIVDQDENRERRMERANRWIRVNQCINCTITMVALLFSLLLFSILVCWVVLTSAYVVSIDKPCDVPLKIYYWFATSQLILDVFRGDIMRFMLCHEPNDYSRQRLPRRVVLYNTTYIIFAMIVLSLGVRSAFIDHSTCSKTASELFQTSKVFIALSAAAWLSVLLVYLLPFFFIGIFVTRHGYLPPSTIGEQDVVFRRNIFSRNMSAPAECVELLREVKFEDFPSDYPNECCVCMVEFSLEDVIVMTPCEHVFHKSCCREWLRQARSCPVCRTDLPSVLGMTGISSPQYRPQLIRNEGRRGSTTIHDESLTGEGVQRDVVHFFRRFNFETES